MDTVIVTEYAIAPTLSNSGLSYTYIFFLLEEKVSVLRRDFFWWEKTNDCYCHMEIQIHVEDIRSQEV